MDAELQGQEIDYFVEFHLLLLLASLGIHSHELSQLPQYLLDDVKGDPFLYVLEFKNQILNISITQHILMFVPDVIYAHLLEDGRETVNVLNFHLLPFNHFRSPHQIQPTFTKHYFLISVFEEEAQNIREYQLIIYGASSLGVSKVVDYFVHHLGIEFAIK